MTTNHRLTDQARHLASKAEPGTLDRKAAGSLAIALHTTRTLAGTRRILTEVQPDDVRAAAEQLLDELTAEGQPS